MGSCFGKCFMEKKKTSGNQQDANLNASKVDPEGSIRKMNYEFDDQKGKQGLGWEVNDQFVPPGMENGKYF